MLTQALPFLALALLLPYPALAQQCPRGTLIAEATDAMRELVLGRELRCELDGSRTWDRCVGTCYLERLAIAEAMVRSGLARDCPRFSGGRYAEAEHQAAVDGATIGRTYPLPGYCR